MVAQEERMQHLIRVHRVGLPVGLLTDVGKLAILGLGLMLLLL